MLKSSWEPQNICIQNTFSRFRGTVSGSDVKKCIFSELTSCKKKIAIYIHRNEGFEAAVGLVFSI